MNNDLNEPLLDLINGPDESPESKPLIPMSSAFESYTSSLEFPSSIGNAPESDYKSKTSPPMQINNFASGSQEAVKKENYFTSEQ